MLKGWIQLHRKLRDNPIYKIKPFSKGHAWVDLLLRGNHKVSEFIINNAPIKILPGQVLTSEKELAENWGWSRHKVRNFLELVSKWEQIRTPERTPRYTLITLTNWGSYQSSTFEKDIQKDNGRTSEGHQKDTFNNVKKVKEVIKEKNSQLRKDESDSSVKSIISYFSDKHLAHTKNKPFITSKNEENIKRILSGVTDEDTIKKYIDTFFKDQDPFLIKRGKSFDVFLTSAFPKYHSQPINNEPTLPPEGDY